MTDEEKQQQERLDQEARARAEQETFERLTTHEESEGQGKTGTQTGAQHDHIERNGPAHHAGITPPVNTNHGRSPADRAQGRAQEADRAGEKTSPSEVKDWAAKGKEKEEDLAQSKSQTANQTQQNTRADNETHQQRR